MECYQSNGMTCFCSYLALIQARYQVLWLFHCFLSVQIQICLQWLIWLLGGLHPLPGILCGRLSVSVPLYRLGNNTSRHMQTSQLDNLSEKKTKEKLKVIWLQASGKWKLRYSNVLSPRWVKVSRKRGSSFQPSHFWRAFIREKSWPFARAKS